LKIDQNKNVSLVFVKCDKQKEIDKLMSKFIIRHFEDEKLYCPFKSCLDYFALERHHVIKRLLEFKNNPKSRSVYISGLPENGKSHILAVFSGFLAKQEATKSIAFIDCADELQYLNKLRVEDENYFDYYFDQIKNVQYLFLDDLGKEFKNKIILEEVLIPLVKYRNENNLVTFISSNICIKDIPNFYNFGKDMKSVSYNLMNELLKNFDECYLGSMKFSILK
jgi:DNA replication protein DnaC